MAISAMLRPYVGLFTDERRGNILQTKDAVCEELDEIERRRQKAQVARNRLTNPCGETLDERAARLGLTALCLSGGGIRSAAFCLGVLQSLAKMRLLNEFDYLSTVSGGGFIGGWLQMLIRDAGDIKKAQAQLAENNAPALQRLRAFTNYLTPRTGPFSADVWAGIVLYLRNLLLNWMIFAPLFLLAALAPIFYRTSIAAFRDLLSGDMIWPVTLMVAVGAISLATSAWQACVLLPSHRTAAPGLARTRAIVLRILVPSMVWATLAPVVINYQIVWRAMPEWAVFRSLSFFLIGGYDTRSWIIPASYGLALTAGYALAWLTHADGSEAGRTLYRRNALRWGYATACSTGLIALAIYLIQPGGVLYHLADLRLPGQDQPWLGGREITLSTFGPLWFIGTHVFHTTFYVAFRKEAVHADLDREWLARLNGVILLVGVVWTIFALSCLVLPVLFSFALQDGSWRSLKVAFTAAATAALGAVGALLGKRLASQLETAAVAGGVWSRWLPNALAGAFAIGVFLSASSVLQPTLGQLALWWNNPSVPDKEPWHVAIAVQLICAAVLSGLVMCFGRVNVNRFSMHAIYRNRLARAFLGSARTRRRADPFTGFDASDNPPIGNFLNANSGQRLFPVINMTLNVTSGSNTAWAERKAEALCATPLTVGSAMLRHPSQQKDGSPPLGAFAQTTRYAGMEGRGDTQGKDLGPRLGSLLTISGAAVSPNWGYHSSPLTAFLMTLFNVRLGAWLPNPAVATQSDLRLAKPRNSVFALLCEMVGVTTDTSQAVYLSDGGHFENLGLYEMLRRRCERIVVIDAGQDGNCEFFDLGNAIRKARIDLNVEVAMPEIRIMSRKVLEGDKSPSAGALAIAVGSITYPSGRQGQILYLKPSFLSHLPADVLAYGRSNKTFPHDSTAEQWFSESQFESYRVLGKWHFDQLASDSLEDLFAAAQTTVDCVGSSKRVQESMRETLCCV